MLPPALLGSGPRLIGATGGSGTRVFARVARLAGLYTGTDLNDSEDAIRFGAYSDRWVDEYVRHGEEAAEAMEADLRRTLCDHLADYSGGGPWGWKEPRSIYLLPFWHSRLPSLRFLHVVRDGRDMALSANQNQLRKHGGAVLGEPIRATDPRQSIALWSAVNLGAARYGERELRAHYLRLRFEDLCARPLEVIAKMLAFFSLQGDAQELAREVRPPASLGRGRALDAYAVTELETIGREALECFGYTGA